MNLGNFANNHRKREFKSRIDPRFTFPIKVHFFLWARNCYFTNWIGNFALSTREKKAMKAAKLLEIQKLLLKLPPYQRWPLMRRTKFKLIQGGKNEPRPTRIDQTRKPTAQISG